MKTKIILALLIALFVQLSSFGQFEMYDLQMQMQTEMQMRLQLQMQLQKNEQDFNNMLNKISKEHSYNCTNGKDLTCSYTISRMSGGFVNPVARIQNKERTKTKLLDITCNFGNLVTVLIIGNESWKLAYNDRITITTNGNISESFDIGVDDNMSEIDWNAYKDQLINESKQQIQRNIVKNSVNQQINNSAIVYPTIQPYNNSTSSNLRLIRVTCSSCNGTGISSGWSTVAAYGSTQEKWCPNCNKWVSATHGPHLNCIPCQGKGYTETYVP
jgi:hypothetical protein